MICPRCGGSEIIRTVGEVRAGFAAAILCESCDRQASIVRDNPGDAIDATEALFFERSGSDGRKPED